MTEMAHKTLHRGIYTALAATACFGVFPAASRAVYAEGGNAVSVILVTTWVRAIALAGFSLLARKRLFASWSDFKESAIGGAFQTVSILCILTALGYLPGPIVVIIVFTHTLMLLFFMAWRGEIKLDPITVASTVAALGGLCLVLDLWHAQSKANYIGIALAFVAAGATLSRIYVYGKQTQVRYPTVVGAENFLIAAVFVSFFAFVSPPHFSLSIAGYYWLGAASISLTLGTFFLFYGISLLGSFRYSLFSKVEPIFTSLFSVWFLGEVLKFQQYMGIVVVVCSLILYQVFEQRRIKRT